MKKLVALVIIAVLLAVTLGLMLPLAPKIVAQQSENRVGVQFSTYWTYDSSEDTFTNGEITSWKEWHTYIGSGVPLPKLTLILDSTINFDKISKENLTTVGPPTYVWSFSDISQGFGLSTYVGFGNLDSHDVVPVTFTPGFDASRSIDKTEFSASSTQNITIKLTPRKEIDQLEILVFADENDLVNPVITNPTGGDGVELRQEGHQLFINPADLELNTTWTITVTIQVNPKVPEVKYMPSIGINWREPLNSGIASGNSFSFPVTDMGTWTLRTEDSYRWDWTDEVVRQVRWNSYSREEGYGPIPTPLQSGEKGDGSTPSPQIKGNQVWVGFLNTLSHSVYGDNFTNTEVTGAPLWRIADTENIADETGEPVRGFTITLDSDQAFDWVNAWGPLTTIKGPPTYKWFYGDLDEDYTGHPKDASVGWTTDFYTFKWTPGFDVSRSFDKTIFTGPDTQTVTIKMTRRDDSFERVLIAIVTEEYEDLVDAVIISVDADCYSEITTGGRYVEFGNPREGIPVELNNPLTIIATLQVTPKVSEVEYKPHVHIAPHYQQKSGFNTVEGDSFSHTNEAGTWTVSAEGNYVWKWNYPADSFFRGSVDLMDYASARDQRITWPVVTYQVITYVAFGVAVIILTIFLFFRRRRGRVV